MKQKVLFSISLLFLIMTLPLMTVMAQTLPPIPETPTDNIYVVDQLDWLDRNQENKINLTVKDLSDRGIAQIGVLTTDDCGSDAKRYRYEVFNTWGIGHANKNNGLLIAVCWYGGDESRRSIEQEVGYGLEGNLPDTLTNKVAKEVFRPYFAEGQPGQGLVAMVQVYNNVLRGVDLDEAISGALEEGNIEPISSELSDEEALGNALMTPICGLSCIWWLLILAVILLVLYLIGVSMGIFTGGSGGSFSGGGWSSGGSSDSGGGGSFGGGSSGGGGSSTSF